MWLQDYWTGLQDYVYWTGLYEPPEMNPARLGLGSGSGHFSARVDASAMARVRGRGRGRGKGEDLFPQTYACKAGL